MTFLLTTIALDGYQNFKGLILQKKVIFLSLATKKLGKCG